MNILLAEDSPINQTFALRALEMKGHDVAVANNGLEAIQLWEDLDFELILMDVQMPQMDGLEATRQIRCRETESNSSRRTLIVAITAHAMKGDREKCLTAGMDGYLTKTIRPTRLFSVVVELAKPAAERSVEIFSDEFEAIGSDP
ncbi:MAG: response regulator [Mariniblastus sp.]|nr:response regulator [Mariniblastus sp.]